MATDTAIEVVMPQMGVSVSEGTITKWLKNEGEEIAADESLLEISTDKVDTEVPSPGSGVLLQILVPEGETVDVGKLLKGKRLKSVVLTGNQPFEGGIVGFKEPLSFTTCFFWALYILPPYFFSTFSAVTAPCKDRSSYHLASGISPENKVSSPP
jgi:hypothetical protein